jgi:hypothetical protein
VPLALPGRPEAESPAPGEGFGMLRRSALVLAGASRGHVARSSAEDGLLTADEARSLDLNGTQRVVLSACETGQGELSIGQGVYGLRRAFLIARHIILHCRVVGTSHRDCGLDVAERGHWDGSSFLARGRSIRWLRPRRSPTSNHGITVGSPTGVSVLIASGHEPSRYLPSK